MALQTMFFSPFAGSKEKDSVQDTARHISKVGENRFLVPWDTGLKFINP